MAGVFVPKSEESLCINAFPPGVPGLTGSKPGWGLKVILVPTPTPEKLAGFSKKKKQITLLPVTHIDPSAVFSANAAKSSKISRMSNKI